MSVFPLVEKEISNTFAADLSSNSGAQLTKQAHKGLGTGTTGRYKMKTNTRATFTKNHFKKEIPQRKVYTEEPAVKDPSWNIYTGNPGFYTTVGDTAYFGNVTNLPDSTFLKIQHTIVPKTLKPYGIVGKQLVIPNQDWILGVILILWMIFASVRVGFPKYLSQIFVSIFNFGSASRLFRQRGYKTMYGAIRLDFIFHLILPLSVFQIARFYKVDISGFPSIVLFLGLLLIINGFFFIKILLNRLVGTIAMLKDQTDESIFNIRLYFKALGLILLPLVTIHAIIAETNFITVWIMAGLIIIMYLATIFRTIYLGHQKDISIFYLILYLCTLEILPLLLIFKLISVP